MDEEHQREGGVHPKSVVLQEMDNRYCNSVKSIPGTQHLALMVYSHWPELIPGQGPGTNGLYKTVWKLSHYT